MKQKEKKFKLFRQLNGRIFFLPAAAVAAILIWGLAVPSHFASAAQKGLQFILENFNWFLVPLTFAAVVFCLWAALSKYGRIRLGGENAAPKIKTLTWFAISLCSGMGIGITYFATYQPLYLFYNPPSFLTDVTAGSEEAFITALRYSFIEWGLHPYALYTCAGVAIAFMFYNGKRSYRISEGLYPLLKDKTTKRAGDLIDCFAVFVIIAGLGASAGTAVMQLAQGFELLFGFGNTLTGWLVMIIIVAVIYIVGSFTGLHKILSWLGNANLWFYIAIMVFALIMIDPAGILDTFWTAIGDYLQNFLSASLYLEPLSDTGWVGSNNTFYFTWWMVFAPFTGLFLVKLAYGRTIRQFVLVNMIVPAIFVLFWFTVFGGGAMLMDAETGGEIYRIIEEAGPSMAWYALLEQLPFAKITTFAAWIIVAVSFITLAQSLTMSLASMSCKGYSDTTGETKPPAALCIFWGVIIAATAYMLLYSGGRDTIETVVVICGLPTGVLLLFMMISHVKAMLRHKEFDLSDNPTRID